MKQKLKLITYLLGCGIIICVSMYAGRNAYKNCDKCHVVIQKNETPSNILTGLYKSYPAGIKP